MATTIQELTKLLKKENKTINSENLIQKAVSGGKHSFDIITLVHNTEIEFYKKKITKLENEIASLKKINIK